MENGCKPQDLNTYFGLLSVHEMGGISISSYLGEAAALLGAILFGTSNVLYRSLREDVDSTTIISLKTWETAIFLFGLVLLLGTVEDILSIPPVSFLLLSVSMIIGPVIGDLVYLKGQELVGVSRAFPIAMSYPLMTYIFELVLARELLRLTKGLGILIIVLGVVLVSRSSLEAKEFGTSRRDFSSVRTSQLGLLLAILAAALWATATVTLRLGIEVVDPILANFVRVVVGSLFVAPLFVFKYYKGQRHIPSQKTTLLVILGGFFGMTLSSMLYVTAVGISGASTTAALSATAPLFTLPFTIIFLKEKLTSVVVLGTLFTVVGVWLLLF